MRAQLLIALAALLGSAPAPTSVGSDIGPALAAARAFAATTGETLWPGYGSAPFGFLLLENNKETLLCQPGQPMGFNAEPAEPHTGCAQWSRARGQLPNALLAAMPVLGPPSTIVMGTPEATGHSRASWLRTILHEHFHQWQNALPRYYARVDALDLKGGDETGMWMLNFPFPYENAAVGRAYAGASQALADALDRRGKSGFTQAFDRYLAVRRAFTRSVSPRDWRYLDFQLWQEGTARWTEIQLGKMYPDPKVRESALELEAKTRAALRTPDLRKQKRELAYPFGAGEAMLMAACGSAWREAYPSVLGHDTLIERARRACSR